MPYVVPQFPLPVNIWRNAALPTSYIIPDVVTVGNLSPGRRSMVGTGPGPASLDPYVFMEVLLPALTDVRAAWNAQQNDLMEIPAGSTRFYLVVQVDDIGKGFANEHRIAWLQQSQNGAAFNVEGAIPLNVPLP